MNFLRKFLLLHSLLLTAGTSAQEYNFRTFTQADGLAQQYIYTILQDPGGFLWIGTADGLSSYDGFSFKKYTVADSLASGFITASVSLGNSLWFGHRGGEISFFNGKSFRKVKTFGRTESPVTTFSADRKGNLWCSTLSDGFFMVKEDQLDTATCFSPGNLNVSSFEYISDDLLIVSASEGLFMVRRTANTGDVGSEAINSIPSVKINKVRRSRDGSSFLVATSGKGIYRLSVSDGGLKTERIMTSPELDIADIQDICEDSRGNIWIAAYMSGLAMIDREGDVISFNSSAGFPSDNVRVLFEDREGTLWAGNFGDGLTMITPRLFRLTSFRNDTYGRSVFATAEDANFRWTGTERGLIKSDRRSGKILNHWGSSSEIRGDTVTSVYISGDNDIWIGTYRNGLFRLDASSNRLRRYGKPDGILENSVTAIAGSGDQIWAGTRKGLCRIDLSTDEQVWYTISQGGLPHNSVISLLVDRRNRLWVTTNSSILTSISGGKVTRMPVTAGRGNYTLGPLAEDSLSRIWIGSRGGGVFVIDGDSVSQISVREGLLSDYCYSMLYDGLQNIWAGHSEGFSRIRVPDLSVKAVRAIPGIPGKFSLNQNAASPGHDGKMLFGTDRGTIEYDPEFSDLTPVPPALSLLSVKVNEKEVEIREGRVILRPGIYTVNVNYTGVSLLEPELVTYQYMLEGYDNDYSYTRNRSVLYNRLGDGRYRFVLNAISGDGAVTDTPALLEIYIRKPVWKYWWFYMVCLSFLTLLVWLYIKWRVRKLTEEKRILELKVTERTREIEHQKNQIALQMELIEQKNSSITSSITYAKKIQHAIFPPPELIDSLLPENFLFHNPKDIVSGDFYWITEKNGKIIVAVADCTGHGVPGAFMSLLGITMLNEIVNVMGLSESNEIVTTLRARVVEALLHKRRDFTTTDGMDIALCVIDRKKNILQFTGAMNDLVFISDGQRIVFKADHMDVSPATYNHGDFTMKEVHYKKGDIIYLFTDGYQDQFGGEFDKKFLRPHFYNTLYEMHRLPMMSQHDFLGRKLKSWMKDQTQTDDITVMGIKL